MSKETDILKYDLDTKLNEAVGWAIKKLFSKYVESHIGERASKEKIVFFDPLAWQPDPEKVSEWIWDYRPLVEALDRYCRELVRQENIEGIKDQVHENFSGSLDEMTPAEREELATLKSKI